ncbi:hypothetical protein OROGR_030982 [Orobanche gracilis]
MTTGLTAATEIPAATRDRWFAITAAGRSSPEVVRDSRPDFGSIQVSGCHDPSEFMPCFFIGSISNCTSACGKLEDRVVKQLGRVKFFETSDEHRAESSIR